MSSEMNIKKKSGNVPELRFPEFIGTQNWRKEYLQYLASQGLSNGVFNDPNKVGNGYKLINVLDMYIENTIDENNLSLLSLNKKEFQKNKVEFGDIFFTRSSLVKSGIAYSNIYLGNSDDITFDGHLIRLRPDKNIVNPLFLHYLLKTSDVRNQLVSRGKTATMTTIGQADIASTKICIPELNEQKKIADCLSSLDKVISLQTKKIGALQHYKKGLMQELFPAEGETVPELRFSKFAGGWNIRNLGKLVSIKTGKKNTQDKVPGGKYPFFVRSQQVENIDTYSFDGEAILTAGDGVGVGKVFHYIIGKFDYHQRVYCLSDFRSFVSGKYIYEVFKNNFGMETAKYSAKNSVDSVRMEMITGMKIPLPSLSEQQKIADFLSSLDELIAAETQKLATLKTHKTGLMQQLFPAMDEVNA